MFQVHLFEFLTDDKLNMMMKKKIHTKYLSSLTKWERGINDGEEKNKTAFEDCSIRQPSDRSRDENAVFVLPRHRRKDFIHGISGPRPPRAIRPKKTAYDFPHFLSPKKTEVEV